mmetsp:Transcript_5741/g.13894  ORF Transcript_5741/g.13894 Transcript_5741/m.13894 type:complete len:107 (+) Transcript_5741:254-574(+)
MQSSKKKSAYIRNDQSILTSLILFDDFRFRHPVRFFALPRSLFADGTWYNRSATQRAGEQRPLLVNNNFLVGTEAKTVRAKAHGHWFWDEDRRRCNATAVAALRRG